jgi:hypothetical protein
MVPAAVEAMRSSEAHRAARHRITVTDLHGEILIEHTRPAPE